MKTTTMKRTLIAGALLVLALGGLSAQAAGLKPLLESYAGRTFVAGPVDKGDLDLILQAGIRAPSANNRQPWYFTVVETPALGEKLIGGLKSGEVVVVVSADGEGSNPAVILDCALAAENLYLAAQALGYGSRIYTGPIDGINRGLKSDLGLPRNRSAAILVRIGRVAPGTDAVSGASKRKPAADIVTYR
jgi:nitroreductase